MSEEMEQSFHPTAVPERCEGPRLPLLSRGPLPAPGYRFHGMVLHPSSQLRS